MTLRERIETVFRGGTPDAMAWFGDLTYWYASHEQIGDLPERWRGARGIGRLHQELGVGEYVPGCCAFDVHNGPDVQVRSTVTGDIRTTEWQTPAGTLRERWQYSPPSYSWGHIEFPVKCAADLAVVRYIAAHRRYTPCPEKLEQIDRDYGAGGLPVVAVTASPMAELYKQWVGVMQLSYLLMDEPAAVAETVAVLRESQRPMYEITAASRCGYVMLCENFTAEGMGGLFDAWFRDFLAEKTALLHRHGKKVLCHIDGTLRGLAGKLPEVGVDCLDAVTPQPVGDVAVADLRAVVGPDVLILGGLPGAMFAPPFTRADIERHVREIIRLHKAGGRFLFGVADQVPPNGDLALVRRVTELVESEGRY